LQCCAVGTNKTAQDQLETAQDQLETDKTLDALTSCALSHSTVVNLAGHDEKRSNMK
jgi:hypothetical protein